MLAMQILLEHERACLFHGDSADLGEYLPENSVDAIVCDPPAAVSFMGAKWDDDRGGFDGWTRWLAKVLAPSVRALKPGGHVFCWALPRTSHYAARALELAGLEIRDVHHDAIAPDAIREAFLALLDDEQIKALDRLLASQTSAIFYQAFGTGFPKSLTSKSAEIPEGSGTALKPAVEHWILARKPLTGTVAAVYAEHGTGVLNIDACRIGSETVGWGGGGRGASDNGLFNAETCELASGEASPAVGRWPAHLSLTHSIACEPIGESTETKSAYANVGDTERDGNGTNFAMGIQRAAGKTEITRAVYHCAPGCPVAELDAQSGQLTSGTHAAGVRQGRRKGLTYGDQTGNEGPPIASSKGGASRFFYNATPNATPFAYIGKASRREKDAGLAHLRKSTGGEATGREDDAAGVANPRAGAGRTGGARNVHPTCKSIALMKWLIRLITPPGGTVLDPFAGSGTTGVAALALGMNFIGCEQGGDHGEYLPILVGRLRHALDLEPDLTITASSPDTVATNAETEQPDDAEGSETED